MARPIHLLGAGGKSGCCGKSMATLGLGAVFTEHVRAVTCSAYVSVEEQLQTLRQRPGDQPLPTRGVEISVQDELIAQIEERRKLGIQRYGTQIQPFNGRDALRDLLDELLDGATYAMQVMIERDILLAKIAELEAQKQQLVSEPLTLRGEDEGA